MEVLEDLASLPASSGLWSPVASTRSSQVLDISSISKDYDNQAQNPHLKRQSFYWRASGMSIKESQHQL